jgi:hypothetical protein
MPVYSSLFTFECMNLLNLVLSRIGVCVIYRRVLDWMIGFIDTLHRALGTTGNYSSIAITTLYSLPLHKY